MEFRGALEEKSPVSSPKSGVLSELTVLKASSEL